MVRDCKGWVSTSTICGCSGAGQFFKLEHNSTFTIIQNGVWLGEVINGKFVAHFAAKVIKNAVVIFVIEAAQTII